MAKHSKLYCITANTILLMWFFLDMVGIYFNQGYLVTRSWKEDGIFFFLFLAAFAFFLIKDRPGVTVLCVWLSLWLLTQLLSHEWYTVMGNGEGKIEHFKGSLQWIRSTTRYIPDIYHTILHVLIIAALAAALFHRAASGKNR